MGSLIDLVNGNPFHLPQLLAVMNQAAFQGHVAHQRKSRQSLPAPLEAVEGLDALWESCRVWRLGSPKVTHLKSILD